MGVRCVKESPRAPMPSPELPPRSAPTTATDMYLPSGMTETLDVASDAGSASSDGSIGPLMDSFVVQTVFLTPRGFPSAISPRGRRHSVQVTSDRTGRAPHPRTLPAPAPSSPPDRTWIYTLLRQSPSLAWEDDGAEATDYGHPFLSS